MSDMGRNRVQKARDALDVALRSRDQSPRLYRGAMRAAMEDLDAALATDRGAVEALQALVPYLTRGGVPISGPDARAMRQIVGDALANPGGQYPGNEWINAPGGRQ